MNQTLRILLLSLTNFLGISALLTSLSFAQVATFTVTNTADSGPGSLRAAIEQGRLFASTPVVITFDSTFDTSQTIELESQLPVVLATITITGPGSELLTIDAGDGPDEVFGTSDGFRIFDFSNFNSGINEIVVSGMTLTGGDIDSDGGAIRSRENLTLDDVVIQANAASGRGGGIFTGWVFGFDGTTTILNSRVAGNLTNGNDSSGGGISVESDLVIENSEITGNTTSGDNASGGGVFVEDGALVVDSTISQNSTQGSRSCGGGIAVEGFAFPDATNILGSTIDSNSTSGFGARGGGVWSRTLLFSLTASTVSRNSTTGEEAHGGGIFRDAGSSTIAASTISGNETRGINADGGGLFAQSLLVSDSGASITLSSSTLAGNTAFGVGGGIFVSDQFFVQASFNSFNSIVADNSDNGTAPDMLLDTTNPSVQDVPRLAANNSIFGVANSFTFVGTGNFIGTPSSPVNPMLAPLADNGGPTQTHALLDESIAVDSGTPFGNFVVRDQRGFDRSVGTATDIGAFEFGGVAPEPVFLLGDVNQDGVVDFLDIQPFINLLASQTFKVEADIDENGVVNFLDIAPFINILSGQ